LNSIWKKSSPPSPTSPETKTKDDDTHASESSSKQSKKKKANAQKDSYPKNTHQYSLYPKRANYRSDEGSD
jgi:hypothetical protein